VPPAVQRCGQQQRQGCYDVADFGEHAPVAADDQAEAGQPVNDLQGAELPDDCHLYHDPAHKQDTGQSGRVAVPWVASPREDGDNRGGRRDHARQRDAGEHRTVKRQSCCHR
jgi:hypothetical protein